MRSDYQAIKERIKAAALQAGRNPDEIKLVAVCKGQPTEALAAVFAQGQRIFAESYLQEAEDKIFNLRDKPEINWHFIGRLQGNKTGRIAALFNTIESVANRQIAARLNSQAEQLGKKLNVLIQVSLAGESGKAGCAPDELEDLAQHIAGLNHLNLQGLMTLPPLFDDPEAARPYFARLRELSFKLAPNLPAGAMGELSMGMSGDFEAAISEGATMVRIGTALFGSRSR